jgi:hypothetical protein
MRQQPLWTLQFRPFQSGIIRGAMAHYYLYVKCKTCYSNLFLLHFEFADVLHIPIDYPDKALYFRLICANCNTMHDYVPEDVQTKSSAEPIHPEEWRPPLPFPPEKQRPDN